MINPLYFYLFLILFLVIFKRRDIKKEYFPFFLFSSKSLKNLIEKVAYSRISSAIEFLVDVLTVPSIIFVIYSIVILLDVVIKSLEKFKIKQVTSLIIPGIKAKGLFYIPLLEGIVAIAITAFLHEIFHGVIAIRKGIKIRDAGYGIALIFPIAFVDINEESLKKINKKDVSKILLSGPIANLLILLLALFLYPSIIDPLLTTIINENVNKTIVISKVLPNSSAYYANIPVNSTLIEINGTRFYNFYDLAEFFKEVNKSNSILLKTDKGEYLLKFKNMSGKMLVGIIFEEREKIVGNELVVYIAKFIKKLVEILIIINISVFIINLLPIPISDGGKFLYFILNRKEDEKIRKIAYIMSTIIVIYLIFNALGFFFIENFIKK